MAPEIMDQINALHLAPDIKTAVIRIVENATQHSDLGSPAEFSLIVGDWPSGYREIFWSKYPNKKSKATAMKALDKIAKAGKVRWADLINGIERYIYSRDVQKGFVKHPATWLNGACWQDQEQTTPLPVERPKSFMEVAQEAFENANGARTDQDGGW